MAMCGSASWMSAAPSEACELNESLRPEIYLVFSCGQASPACSFVITRVPQSSSLDAGKVAEGHEEPHLNGISEEKHATAKLLPRYDRVDLHAS